MTLSFPGVLFGALVRFGGLFIPAAACSGGVTPGAVGKRGGGGGAAEEEPESAAGPGEDEAPGNEPGRITVDRSRGEVRLPCRFVNPTRQLEVFACHVSGPTHETVLEFDAGGPELTAALKAIGCRSADFWNASSSGDFARNQGDRVLVLVRWTYRGVARELPAEAMLIDGPTGFASFVRGFSFSAVVAPGAPEPPRDVADDLPGGEDPPGGDPGTTPSPSRRPGVRIPRAVEITLGATTRRNAIFSLLSHPTTLDGAAARPEPGRQPSRSLQPWSFPPVVHPRTVPHLEELVEKKVPATLIFRRVESEHALLRYVRSMASLRQLDDRLPLYQRLEPIVQEIDALKAAVLEVSAAIDRLLDTRLNHLPSTAHPDYAFHAEALQRTGRWYNARMQQLFFEMYVEQDRFRLAWIERQPPSESAEDTEGIVPRVVEIARDSFDNGLRFEPLIAAKETDLAEHEVRELLLRGQVMDLELGRYLALGKGRVREIERRREQLDAGDPGDLYVLRLLDEDTVRIGNERFILGSRRAHLAALAELVGAHLNGSWSDREPCIEARLKLADAELSRAKLQNDLLTTLESIRWDEGDSDDGEDGVTPREKKARDRLGGLRKEEKALRVTLDAVDRSVSGIRARVAKVCGR